MQGSSAFQFGRAAYRAGLLSRRQLAADAWANVQFRLRGSTDAGTQALRERISKSLAGTRVVDLERLGPDVLAGILPRLYPQMLAVAHEHQDAGRQVYIVTAASHELAEMLARVLAFDGAIGSNFSEAVDGVYTGKPDGTVRLPQRQGGGDHGAWPNARTSIWPLRSPTRIRNPISRCCRLWATPWRSTRIRSCWRWPAARTGECCASIGLAGG